MFGLRYHVASLAAVFVALAVGILLGVALSGKVSDAEESFERNRIAELERRLDEDVQGAEERADAAVRRGAATEELFARAYPALMDSRLEGRSVAVLFLGPVDGSMRAAVERTLADAGGIAPLRVVGLDVPVDGSDLHAALEGDEALAAYARGEDDFSALGRELGRELVEGGETPLWDSLATRLVEERSGTTSLPVDGAVVVGTWAPPEDVADGGDEAAAEVRATTSLLEALVRGLDGTGVPVVGVAETSAAPELIDFYREQGISSVDDVDAPSGRLALALLLAGAEPGNYGVDEGSDGVVPPIEPLPAPEGD
ncbi:MAG TPA: copper transporter [Gaiellaceae bacterium]|nr:copper transporter [Gaiellaceae bacterium]